jgi:2,4-dienoyl-CoA reductase-like NADH-dependent reductase (Old Yellow Enzyme family)
MEQKIVAQLNHGGRQCPPELIGIQPLSALGVEDKLTGIKPVAMTESQIEKTIESFVSAAKRVKRAGFDGVQIHAAHGYLINQFLSAYTNRRKDKWGGSLENRMRFLIEIYKQIRLEVGKDYPILVKLNSDD